MALLNHSEVKNTGKKILTRGPKIETANKVNRGDNRTEAYLLMNLALRGKNVLSSYVTEPVNIRVDNHIRNHIAALITMGHSDTQKDMVELVLNLYIENLSNGEFKRFEDLVQIYEDKDVKKHQKKAGL
ncbi:DUF5388 domain-containing protein [uncultured Trichococcus sp.]|uniref:DUF5388 domain-containing protein n=1 Tax=uncultured Trichococcus sp. TaxID=189665 RepID=UPI0029C91972|nr:DUF5388 domain-containing protein [uncultured Trichococcus sp.]